jgi:hypothetical protein
MLCFLSNDFDIVHKLILTLEHAGSFSRICNLLPHARYNKADFYQINRVFFAGSSAKDTGWCAESEECTAQGAS